ncbi:MAG: DUF5667 domain-containing protein [Anaerolineales bacterium]
MTRKQDELSGILDSCLELIASGAATVDSVIDQYPQYSDQLRPPLEAAIWLQSRKEVFNPRPGFVKLSHRRLVNRFKEQRSPASASETWSRLPAFFQERRIAVQYSALLTLTAVLLFVGYRSTDFLVQRSIPGDPLYQAKITQEELRVKLAPNEEGQTRLRIEYAQRRVIEMQELVLVGRTDMVDDTLKNFEFQLDLAAEGILTVAKTDGFKAAQLSSLFEQTLRVPVNNFVGIIDSNPELASGGFMEKFIALAAEPFEERPIEFLLVADTTTPTATSTPTFTSTPTPTYTATATFTSTATVFIEPTATATLKATQPPAASPTSTSKPVTRTDPTATAISPPTSAPPPTDPPPPTIAPKPTDEPTPEPAPEKTKKPKPTQHPTYQP